MKQTTFNEIWDEAHNDREEMLSMYFKSEYLSRLLSKKEIIMTRDTIAAAEATRTFDDFCNVFNKSALSIMEEFEIPSDVVDEWRNGTFPLYLKRMIACSLVSAAIEDGRCKTCQLCGEFFFSKHKTALFCEDCCECVF